MAANGAGSRDVVRRNLPCPSCRKLGRDTRGDNLIEYADGHAHCFACGHHISTDGFTKLKQFMETHEKVSESPPPVVLPRDASTTIDVIALGWLSDYDITRQEVIDYKLMWSESRQMLIFPFYGGANNLIAWQARCFKEGYARYYTQGNPDEVFWIPGLTESNEHGIILVEDCVSAIKVGRQAACMPLLGSNLTPIRRHRLRHFTEKLIFWLDYDKAKEAYRYAQDCRVQGYDTKVIVTLDDPKVYTDPDIKEILQGISY